MDESEPILIAPGAAIDKPVIDALSLDELAAFVSLCRRFGVSRIVDCDTHYELQA